MSKSTAGRRQLKSNSGVQLWKEAKQIIPGGNQLLSKRAERYLPEQWPAYFEEAKGCEVWDLDGRHYYDFAQMGVGSCVLGYANQQINDQVKRAIDRGSMTSLNSHEEVALAKKLIGLHPWGEMVRFARTGGEACAIAIRIARAAAKRSKVAFCGYHGWSDWYISANLGDRSGLDDQLLPGLNPLGIPQELRGTILPFHYNRADQLERILTEQKGEVGVIIMEPRRSQAPEPGFLEAVRRLADSANAVLIFDEITSGFRMNLGGIHLLHGVEPDVAVFGKALGNGFPISAIVGKRRVMDAAQETFISSTFWTERIGFTAGLATLEEMQRVKAQATLVKNGERVTEGWKRIAAKHTLQIKTDGIPPLTHIHFEYANAQAIQTLYCQEMLKRGYLLASSVYATIAYTDEIIDGFIENSSEVFAGIRRAIEEGRIEDCLEGPIAHSTFKRLA